MIKVKVTFTRENGEVIEQFTAIAEDKDYSHAKYPQDMMALAMKESIEEYWETEANK